jgi:hypothetical protein
MADPEEPSNGLQLTLPDDSDIPARPPQLANSLAVSFLVSSDFRVPKFNIALRSAPDSIAVVTVPEASMNKNDLLASWKDQIRASGQIRSMQSKPVPKAMQVRPDSLLWQGVL